MEVVTRNIGGSRIGAIELAGRLSCADLVDKYAPPLLIDGAIVVLLNGREVPQRYWKHVTPKETCIVTIATLPRGGDEGGSGKNILAAVASIAIAVVAPFAAAGIAGMMGITSTVAIGAIGAGIGLAGNLLIGAMFKPSAPKIGREAMNSAGSAAQASPTYALSGQSNYAQPYGPVRRLFGKHRIYPVIACAPYVEILGDDQYLTVVYDIGAGDYDVSQIMLGDSPYSYFQAAQYTVHRNTKSPQFSWYWGKRTADPFQIKLGTNWTQLDTQADCGDFILTFVLPSGLAQIDKANGGVVQRTSTFRIEWSEYGSNVWKPLEQAYAYVPSRSIASGVAASHVQVQNTYNFLYVFNEVEEQYGFPAGATSLPLRAVNAAGNPYGTLPAGSAFLHGGVRYTVLSDVPNVYGFVNISPPLRQQILTGSQNFKTHVDSPNPPVLQAYPVSATGNYQITDSRLVQLSLSIRVRPLQNWVAGKKYSIRMLQSGGAGDESNTFGDVYLASIITIDAVQKSINLRNEHTLLECRIRANEQLSGTLDNISVLAQSYLWTYRAGVWGYELNNNPAWAELEVLRGPMNKRPLADDKINLDSFTAWADWCDSLHPVHGEKMAEFNHMVDYYTTVFTLSQTITAAGRATLSIGDGKFGIIMDVEKATPVQVFTPHNSSGFRGSRKFIEAPHAFRAKFMNEQTWKMDERMVYNDGYDKTTATVFEEIDFPGVTRATQVWRDARYRMAQGIHRQEEWQLEVDVENLVCTRGDKVLVAHDVPMLGGLPARIRDVVYDGNGDATQWTLTEPIAFSPATDYGYTIRSLSGPIKQGQLVNPPVDSYTVQPTVPVTGVAVGDLHVWGEMDHVTYEFLVAGIAPKADLAATLTLVPYAGDAIFGADSGPIPPYDPQIDHDLSLVSPPPVLRVNVMQSITYPNRQATLNVSFEWVDYIASSAVSYEIWVDWDLNETDQWVLIGRSNTPSFVWFQDLSLAAHPNYPGTNFCVKVIAVNAFGQKSSLVQTPGVCDTILIDNVVPDAPPYFELDFKRDTITFEWGSPSNPNIDYYEIRYDPQLEGSTYGSTTVVAGRIPWPATSFEVPARIGTYYIKAINTSGVRSDDYAVAFTPVENLWNLNAITDVDDVPYGWPGTKDGFVVVGGTPLVPGGFSIGFSNGFETITPGYGQKLVSREISPGVYQNRCEYYYAETYDGGEIYQTRFTSKITASAFNTSSIMASWVPLASADPIAGDVVGGGTTTIAELVDVWHELRWVEVQNVMADWAPLASADPIGFGSIIYGPWRKFQVGDYTGRTFQFRLVTEYVGPNTAADAGVSISSATIEVDMPDRTDGAYDVRCSPEGTRINYDPPFKERPALAITQDDMQPGDIFRLTNVSQTGFTIQFLDATDTPVLRQFDWIAKGYGARSNTPIIGAFRGAPVHSRKPVLSRFTLGG